MRAHSRGLVRDATLKTPSHVGSAHVPDRCLFLFHTTFTPHLPTYWTTKRRNQSSPTYLSGPRPRRVTFLLYA
eukprot:3524459-Prymnesium_polylepis.1